MASIMDLTNEDIINIVREIETRRKLGLARPVEQDQYNNVVLENPDNVMLGNPNYDIDSLSPIYDCFR